MAGMALSQGGAEQEEETAEDKINRIIETRKLLALFGSTAIAAARGDSDVDILVGFDGPATSERYFGVQFYLEDLFGCGVDLVTDKALRAELRPHIEKEAVDV